MPFYTKDSTFDSDAVVKNYTINTIRSAMEIAIKDRLARFMQPVVVISDLHKEFVHKNLVKAIVINILDTYPTINARVLQIIINSIPIETEAGFTRAHSEYPCKANMAIHGRISVLEAFSSLEFKELDDLYKAIFGNYFKNEYWSSTFNKLIAIVKNYVRLYATSELIDNIANNTLPTTDSIIDVDCGYQTKFKSINYTALSIELTEKITEILASKLLNSYPAKFLLNIVVIPATNPDNILKTPFDISVELYMPEQEMPINILYNYTNCVNEHYSELLDHLSKYSNIDK